ncbi:hypothetical protein SHIRM173S_05328 [Streptomyces hirsutus]
MASGVGDRGQRGGLGGGPTGPGGGAVMDGLGRAEAGRRSAAEGGGMAKTARVAMTMPIE